MLAGVLLVATSLIGAVEMPHGGLPESTVAVVQTVDDQVPTETPTQPTVNEFIPEDRSIGECISALPKPGCGSEARGGWRQSLILVAIMGGLGFIVWRVVRSARKARADQLAPAEHPSAPPPARPPS